ncbi:MAG: Asd/ArgC dimerization domain-containing protein [Enterocloster sp.]
MLTAWKEFEPYEVVATTYQAISGAGKTFKDWPEMEGNIIPYIGGEEEKSEQEPLRLWGNGRGRRDCEGAKSCHHLPVHTCTGTERPYGCRFCEDSGKK